MNDETNCSGSLKLIATAERPTVIGSWTGGCPECGKRVELGYAGRVPVHEPPRIGGRSGERLRHVQVRDTNVVHRILVTSPWLPKPRGLDPLTSDHPP
jgi:hypothetical protein